VNEALAILIVFRFRALDVLEKTSRNRQWCPDLSPILSFHAMFRHLRYY
jgi:hypothetical protein